MKWEERKFRYEKPVTESGMVSIVIPTFNRKRFLCDRIQEILNFKYTNWEVIIVNDGGESVADIIPDHPSFRLINLDQNSKTVSIPRNVGVSYAKGEFICPADDDVIQMDDKLVNLLNNIGTAPLCYGNRHEFYANTNLTKTPKFIAGWIPQQGAGVDNGQFIYRKSCYERIPYVVSTHACDYFLAVDLYSHCGEFAYIDIPVCTYIWHDNNRSLSDKRKTVPLDIDKFKTYFNVLNDVSLKTV